MAPFSLPTTYSIPWVSLSFLTSFLGALGGLTAMAAAGASPTLQGRRVHLALAALSLGGVGIWAMHFIGMGAVRFSMRVDHALPALVGSLAVAVVPTAAALHWVAARPGAARVPGAGATLGLAVASMHYLGMGGMRFDGHIVWSVPLAALSVVIAIAAASAGLWLAVSVRGHRARAAAALVIALAVCAMHYTGMAAADFVCTSPRPSGMPAGEDW